MKKVIIIITIVVVLVLFCACAGNEVTENEVTLDVEIQGVLPTPLVMMQLSDAYLDEYKREPERVDYETIKGQELRIRSYVEFEPIFYSSYDDNDYERGVDRYGISSYYHYGDLVVFSSYADMATVLANQDFQSDFSSKYGLQFQPEAYYTPTYITSEDNMAVLLVNDGKCYFRLGGNQYSEGGDYFKVVWKVLDVDGAPGADEVATFYAELNGLEVHCAALDTVDVYYFTALSGCALFEKMNVKTNDPATTYIWNQDDVMGILILPGGYNQKYLDLCVLERHELK